MNSRFLLASLFALPLTATFYVACSDDDAAKPGTAQDSGPGTNDTGASPIDSGASDSAPDPTKTVSCAVYCDEVVANCKGDLADAGTAAARYPSKQSCLNACAKTPIGNFNDGSGDTVGCRQYHAGVAAGNPTLHCPHSGLTGVDVCSRSLDAGEIPGYCQTLCDRTMALCGPLPESPYTSAEACYQACKGFDYEGGKLVSTGNTLGCREFYLALAYDGNGSADASATAKVNCPNIAAVSAACN